MEGTTVNRTVPSIVGSPDTTSDSLIVGLIICILIILIALIAGKFNISKCIIVIV